MVSDRSSNLNICYGLIVFFFLITTSSFAEVLAGDTPVEILADRGQRYLSLGMTREAYETFDGAMKKYGSLEVIRKGLRDAVTTLAAEHTERGEYTKARELYEKAEQLFPDDLAIKSGLAELLFLSGDFYAAREQAEKLLESGDPVASRLFLARVKVKLHQIDLAVEEYANLLAIEDSDQAHFEKGILHFRRAEKIPAMHHLGLAANSKDKDIRENAENYLKYINRPFGGYYTQPGKNGEIWYVFHGFSSEDSSLINDTAACLDSARYSTGSLLGFFPQWYIHVFQTEGNLFEDSFPEDTKEVFVSPPTSSSLWEIKYPSPVTGRYKDKIHQYLIREYTLCMVRNLSNSKAPVWLAAGIARAVCLELDRDFMPELSESERLAIPVPASGAVRSLKGLEILTGSRKGDRYILGATSAASFIRFLEKRGGSGTLRRLLNALAIGHPFNSAFSEALMANFDQIWREWLINRKVLSQ